MYYMYNDIVKFQHVYRHNAKILLLGLQINRSLECIYLNSARSISILPKYVNSELHVVFIKQTVEVMKWLHLIRNSYK